MGVSAHTTLLDRDQSKAFRLISSFPLTDSLQPPSFRQNVTSLAIFYQYFHANCSIDIANCMPPLLRFRRSRIYSSSHPYSVLLSNARFN